VPPQRGTSPAAPSRRSCRRTALPRLRQRPLSRKKKITSAQGDSIAWRKTETIETEDTYALCRCGQSGSKPFCDGTHARRLRRHRARRHAADDRADPIVEGSLTEETAETVSRARASS
jgi:CDGSH-type Zn-finger protein